jgi:ADP-ribose pyrophosphatase
MRILFLCSGNACRSQMAEGFAKALSPRSWRIESAGFHPRGLDPRAVDTMNAVGIDIKAQRSKAVQADQLAQCDVLVTLCEGARGSGAGVGKNARHHHWSISDPASCEGPAEDVAAQFARVRDEIRRRVEVLIFALGDGQAEVRSITPIHDSGFMKFRREDLLLPNGAQCRLDIIRHPGAACVVPIYKNAHVVLIRQYRHAAGGFILEAPAGKLDHGESPENCAAREVIEEAGVKAGRLHKLGPIFTTPGFTDEVIHLFAATDLSDVPAAPEADEIIDTIVMPLREALELAASGEIRDGKTLCALWRLEQELTQGRIAL